MIAATRAELRKYFTTRMWWGMALGCIAGAALFAGLFALMFASVEPGTAGAPDLSTGPGVTTVYTAGIQIGYLLTLVVGIMVIGSEFRHKTATATFLGTPRRGRVVAAKALALALISCFYGLLTVAAGFGVGAAVLSAKGFSPVPDAGYVGRSLALSLLVLVVWALIGLGAGVLIRNQVAAILVALGFAWLVEPLLGFGLMFAPWDWAKSVAKYLPSQATQAVLGGAQQMPDGGAVSVLSWQAGSLVLLAYAAVATLLGLLLTLRRDVP